MSERALFRNRVAVGIVLVLAAMNLAFSTRTLFPAALFAISGGLALRVAFQSGAYAADARLRQVCRTCLRMPR